jgi:hypothetical protein
VNIFNSKEQMVNQGQQGRQIFNNTVTFPDTHHHLFFLHQ